MTCWRVLDWAFLLLLARAVATVEMLAPAVFSIAGEVNPGATWPTPICDAKAPIVKWPCGLMDKALVFGTKDCRFESCQGHDTGIGILKAGDESARTTPSQKHLGPTRQVPRGVLSSNCEQRNCHEPARKACSCADVAAARWLPIHNLTSPKMSC